MVVVGSAEDARHNPFNLIWVAIALGVLTNEVMKPKERTPETQTAVYVVENREENGVMNEYSVKDTLLGYDPAVTGPAAIDSILEAHRSELRQDVEYSLYAKLDLSRYRHFRIYYVPIDSEKTVNNPLRLHQITDMRHNAIIKKIIDDYYERENISR